jgi:putative transposase
MDASQEHTRWNCRYHIVWAPKFKRKIIYGKYRKEIGAILRKLCDYKGIEIVVANACIDHIHMCLRILPKYSVSTDNEIPQGKLLINDIEQFQNLKYKFGNRHFWCKGYYVSTVGTLSVDSLQYSTNGGIQHETEPCV